MGARLLPTHKELTCLAWAIGFSPDGQILATCSNDQVVKLWNTRTGQYLTALQVHPQPILSMAFSPDGQTLASGSNDQTVKLWHVTTGQLYQTLDGHSDRVCSVAYAPSAGSANSPDGQTLVSSGLDEMIKLWDGKTGECLQTLKAEKPYEGMNVTGAVGLTEAQRANLKVLGAVES